MINLLTIDAASFLDLTHQNLISAILPLEVRFEELLATYPLPSSELLNPTTGTSLAPFSGDTNLLNLILVISPLAYSLTRFLEDEAVKSTKTQVDELASYYARLRCTNASLRSMAARYLETGPGIAVPLTNYRNLTAQSSSRAQLATACTLLQDITQEYRRYLFTKAQLACASDVSSVLNDFKLTDYSVWKAFMDSNICAMDL
jgi:hypothetical protein